MKEIPIGVSSFQNILEYNYIYVDKTKEILHLIITTFMYLSPDQDVLVNL